MNERGRAVWWKRVLSGNVSFTAPSLVNSLALANHLTFQSPSFLMCEMMHCLSPSTQPQTTNMGVVLQSSMPGFSSRSARLVDSVS